MQDPLPYCGPPPDPTRWMFAWNLDPLLIAGIASVAAVGYWQLQRAPAAARRAFHVAIGAAVLAFVSPLCAMTVALFSARSLHHLVVLGVLAPALALAFPIRRLPLGLSFAALSAALWLWHLPLVYTAAWDSAAIYWLMQAALILPAWAFWSGLTRRPDLGHALWLVPLVGQMGLLGALLTFAPRPFYLEHLAQAERFGLSALSDQQLAGLVMWVPGMLPLAGLSALMLWHAWQREARA